MGNWHLGPDELYTLTLRDRYNIHTFIETGTYKAGTTTWAAKHFERVVTIEAYPKRIAALQNNPQLQALANVTFLYGDSRAWIVEALRQADQPCLFWLDAHWCGEGAHDTNGDECPLREELEAILADPHAAKHVIMIDDARLFTDPVPYPHDPAQWLSYAEIEALLPGRSLSIDKDIIYALPG